MREKRARVDWDAIEPHYRAGVRSLRDIGAEFSVSDPAIIKHAKAFGWTRNLGAKIKDKADAKVAAALIASERRDSPAGQLTEAVRVEVEAEVQSRIRLCHQQSLTKLRVEAERLLAELSLDDDDLKSRISSLKALTETLVKLVPLERQAYGVDKLIDDFDDKAVIDPIEGAKRLAFILARAGAQLSKGA